MKFSGVGENTMSKSTHCCILKMVAWPVKGIVPFKFFFIIIHLREKRVKQKIICSHPKFVLRLFLKNEENELHRKYTCLGGPAENLSPSRISQIY